MAQSQHPLERRAQMLAGKIQGRVADLGQAMQAANGRIPFHTKLSQGTALEWWAQHRYDDLGQQVLQNLDPLDVLHLDRALGEYGAQQEALGLPQESGGFGG